MAAAAAAAVGAREAGRRGGGEMVGEWGKGRSVCECGFVLVCNY